MTRSHPVLTTAIEQMSDCLLVLRILEERSALQTTMEAMLPMLIGETVTALQTLLQHLTEKASRTMEAKAQALGALEP